MKAYMLVRAVIHDREKFVNGYGAQAAKLVDKFGGNTWLERLELLHWKVLMMNKTP